jgi:MYXO-CTERM domain-containing protein
MALDTPGAQTNILFVMRTFTALFISALVSAIPSAAFASSACECGLRSDPLGSDPKAVPPNAKLFVNAGTDRSSLSLAKVMNGVSQPVPFHFEDTSEGTGDGWLVPDALLDPSATYEYIEGEFHQPFTTAAGEDTIAPTFTTAGLFPDPMPGACEDHISAALRTEGGTDNSTDQSLWTWKVSIKSPAKTIYFPPLGNGYLGRMDTDDRSWDTCLSNFPEAELDKKYEATLVAFDWAGNASQAVTTSFELAAGGAGCGCHMVDSSKSTETGAFFLGAMALMAFRRRRH